MAASRRTPTPGAFVLVLSSLVAAGGTLAAGCSGATVDDLFQSSGGAGGASTTGTAGKGATSTSSGNPTSTGSSPTSGTSTATGPSTSVTTGPGGMTSSVSSGPVTSASTGMVDPMVDCGGQTCSIQNGGCCWNQFQQSAMCSPNGNCPNFNTQIECQRPSDCPAQICCAQRNSAAQSSYDAVVCDSQCDNPSRVVCDPLAPQCPLLPNGQGMMVQSVCKASQLLPQGYYVCTLP